MATRFTPDDLATVIAAEQAALEAAVGVGYDPETDGIINDESSLWLLGSHGLALTAIPWGTDRATQMDAAATALSLSLSTALDNPWPFEQEFWAAYADSF